MNLSRESAILRSIRPRNLRRMSEIRDVDCGVALSSRESEHLAMVGKGGVSPARREG